MLCSQGKYSHNYVYVQHSEFVGFFFNTMIFCQSLLSDTHLVF